MPITSASPSSQQALSPEFFRSQPTNAVNHSPNQHSKINPNFIKHLENHPNIPQEALKSLKPEGIAEFLSCFRSLLRVGHQASPKEEKDAIDPLIQPILKSISPLTVTNLISKMWSGINNRIIYPFSKGTCRIIININSSEH